MVLQIIIHSVFTVINHSPPNDSALHVIKDRGMPVCEKSIAFSLHRGEYFQPRTPPKNHFQKSATSTASLAPITIPLHPHKKQPEASRFRHTDHTSPSLHSNNSTIIFTTYGGGTRFPAYQSCTVLNGISNLFASAVCVSVYRSQISRTVIISAPFAHTSPATPQAPQSSRCSPPHKQHSEFPSCVDTNRVLC